MHVQSVCQGIHSHFFGHLDLTLHELGEKAMKRNSESGEEDLDSGDVKMQLHFKVPNDSVNFPFSPQGEVYRGHSRVNLWI